MHGQMFTSSSRLAPGWYLRNQADRECYAWRLSDSPRLHFELCNLDPSRGYCSSPPFLPPTLDLSHYRGGASVIPGAACTPYY